MTSDSQLENPTWLIFILKTCKLGCYCYSFGSLKKMPGRRCVVQGCNNTPNLEGGISVHISPKNKSARDKWARFVRTHRANFNPQGRFMVCSEHFVEECFERSLHFEGSQRTLRPGSVPSVRMNKNFQEPATSRSVRTRKKVSTCFLTF